MKKIMHKKTEYESKRFNSMGDMAFTIYHDNEEPTAEEVVEGLRRRLGIVGRMDEGELFEAVEVTDTQETHDGK